MSYSKNKVTSIQTLIQNFFLERLIQQRGVTSRTIESYRDTFKIYIKYFYLNYKIIYVLIIAANIVITYSYIRYIST